MSTCCKPSVYIQDVPPKREKLAAPEGVPKWSPTPLVDGPCARLPDARPKAALEREREREREIASAKALGGGAKQGVGDFCPPGQKGKCLVQKFGPIGRTFVSN